MDLTRSQVTQRDTAVPWGVGWERRRAARRATALRLGLMTVPLAFFGLFFAYPIAAIVARGLHPVGHWELGGVLEVVSDPAVLHVLWFTCWQAAASTALTLLLALPGAYVFARLDFPGKQVLRAVVTVPFVLPTVVAGSAFLALLGRGGLLDELWGVRLDTGVWSILLAHVFFNYAVVVRTVGGLWGQLDPRQEEAARVLGASRARRLAPRHAARARPGGGGCRADGLPVHLHLLRRHPDPGRPPLRHAGGADLPGDRRPARPAHRGRSHHAAVRRRRRDAGRARPHRAPPRDGPRTGRPARHRAPPARPRPVGAARFRTGRRRTAADHPARRPRRAVPAQQPVRVRLHLLPRSVVTGRGKHLRCRSPAAPSAPRCCTPRSPPASRCWSAAWRPPRSPGGPVAWCAGSTRC